MLREILNNEYLNKFKKLYPNKGLKELEEVIRKAVNVNNLEEEFTVEIFTERLEIV